MGRAVCELAVNRDKATIVIVLLCLFASSPARPLAPPEAVRRVPPDPDMPPEPDRTRAPRGSRVPAKPPRKKMRRPSR